MVLPDAGELVLYNWVEWLKDQEHLWQGAPGQHQLADSLACGLQLGSDNGDNNELSEELAAVPEALL